MFILILVIFDDATDLISKCVNSEVFVALESYFKINPTTDCATI